MFRRLRERRSAIVDGFGDTGDDFRSEGANAGAGEMADDAIHLAFYPASGTLGAMGNLAVCRRLLTLRPSIITHDARHA
jgi:hypothetical protein